MGLFLKQRKSMKRCSFKVAKAIKEAGYPQEYCGEYFNKYGAIDSYLGYNIARPYAMEVWLWLWREKCIHLNTDTSRKGIVCIYIDETIIHEVKDMKIADPEEAIIAAIEYLVTNNLIK